MARYKGETICLQTNVMVGVDVVSITGGLKRARKKSSQTLPNSLARHSSMRTKTGSSN
jgi:hypothetical protein